MVTQREVGSDTPPVPDAAYWSMRARLRSELAARTGPVPTLAALQLLAPSGGALSLLRISSDRPPEVIWRVSDEGPSATGTIGATSGGENAHTLRLTCPASDGSGTGARVLTLEMAIPAWPEPAMRDALQEVALILSRTVPGADATGIAVYKAIVETAPLPIAVKDTNLSYVFVNPVFGEWFGREASSLLGRTAGDLHDPETAARLEAHDRACLEAGRPVRHGNVLSTRDGRVKETESLTFPVHDADGRVLGVGFFDLDMTERRQAEAALARQTAKVSRIAETLAELLRGTSQGEIAFRDLLERILRSAAEICDVSRASVWEMEEEASRIRLLLMHDRRDDTLTEGLVLTRDQAPAYFEALTRDGMIDATDAQTDPRTAGLRDAYLAPLDVRALYDALVTVAASPRAVICLEQVGRTQAWTQDERLYLAALSSLLSNRFARDDLQHASRALEHLNATLEQKVLTRTRELQQSQQRLADIVNASADCIIELDGTGTVLFCSDRTDEVLGRPREAMIGHSLLTLLSASHERGQPKGLKQLQKAIAKRRKAQNMAIRLTRPDGGMTVLRWTGGPCVLDDGRPGFRLGLSDVTFETMAQEQLVASEQFSSLGRMVAGVAHEVNTPLGVAVTVTTSLVERMAEMERAIAGGSATRDQFKQFMAGMRKGVSLLQTNVERAARLIQSFKQISVDQSQEDMRTITLADYIRAVVDSLQPLIRQQGLRLSLDLDETIVLHTVPGAFAQVLSNLIANAGIHAYGGAGGPLAVTLARKTDALITLSIRDEGAGIPPEVLKHIFEPFYTTRRGSGGSGLGLSIVKGLVTAKLKGHLSVESVEGGGTVFEITLPDTGIETQPTIQAISGTRHA